MYSCCFLCLEKNIFYFFIQPLKPVGFINELLVTQLVTWYMIETTGVFFKIISMCLLAHNAFVFVFANAQQWQSTRTKLMTKWSRGLCSCSGATSPLFNRHCWVVEIFFHVTSGSRLGYKSPLQDIETSLWI